MNKIICTLWLASVAAAGAQTGAVPAALDPLEAINRLREGLVESFNKGDIDALLSHLETNVVVTWQNGEVSQGTAGVRAYYEKMMRGDHPMVKQVTCKLRASDVDKPLLSAHVQSFWSRPRPIL